MKDDSYAGAEEVAALEARRQEAHDEAAIFEAELAGSKGEGYPDDPSYGGTAADVKARRHARGEFAREDYEPAIDPIDNYTGPRTVDEVTNEDELRSFAQHKEDLAREKYSNYDAIVDLVVAKLREEGVDPQDVQRWMLEHDDFPEIAYQAGLAEKQRRRNRLPSQKEIDSMSAEEFTEKLDVLRNAPVEDEESEPSISRRKMKSMNKLGLKDFEEELDRFLKYGD